MMRKPREGEGERGRKMDESWGTEWDPWTLPDLAKHLIEQISLTESRQPHLEPDHPPIQKIKNFF